MKSDKPKLKLFSLHLRPNERELMDLLYVILVGKGLVTGRADVIRLGLIELAKKHLDSFMEK